MSGKFSGIVGDSLGSKDRLAVMDLVLEAIMQDYDEDDQLAFESLFYDKAMLVQESFIPSEAPSQGDELYTSGRLPGEPILIAANETYVLKEAVYNQRVESIRSVLRAKDAISKKPANVASFVPVVSERGETFGDALGDEYHEDFADITSVSAFEESVINNFENGYESIFDHNIAEASGAGIPEHEYEGVEDMPEEGAGLDVGPHMDDADGGQHIDEPAQEEDYQQEQGEDGSDIPYDDESIDGADDDGVQVVEASESSMSSSITQSQIPDIYSGYDDDDDDDILDVAKTTLDDLAKEKEKEKE